METDKSLTNQQVENNLEEVLTSDELDYLEFVNHVLKTNSLALTPGPPPPPRVMGTVGSGPQLPKWSSSTSTSSQNIIEVVYNGKSRELSDLASRQRKEGHVDCRDTVL